MLNKKFYLYKTFSRHLLYFGKQYNNIILKNLIIYLKKIVILIIFIYNYKVILLIILIFLLFYIILF